MQLMRNAFLYCIRYVRQLKAVRIMCDCNYKFNDYVIVGVNTDRDWEYQTDKKE